MLDFPYIPKYWPKGKKFMRLEKGYVPPIYIIGYDTETYDGDILTQQFTTLDSNGKTIDKQTQFVNDENVLDKFLDYLESYPSYALSHSGIVFCFNAKFDLAILLRKFINNFLQDQFEIKYRDWKIKVFCSKNWYASFDYQIDNFKYHFQFLDIQCFFSGSLESVAKTFQCDIGKLKRPENLGYIRFKKSDTDFMEYAQHDATLCAEIGYKILEMHAEFDIPISTGSANLAEKVFRRMFIKEKMQIQFPDPPCNRLAEITYHGGKNGYYMDHPTYVKGVYEYDFNAAYGFAMYSLPSFISGKFVETKKFRPEFAGVYQVEARIQPCQYGILYDTRFNYFCLSNPQTIRSYATGYEIEEGIRSKEVQLKKVHGYIWKPDTTENPIHEYAKYFWEKKNSTPKGNIRYVFYKLCLNSLYGKWIQRNPTKQTIVRTGGNFSIAGDRDTAGGLYNPFIATSITGFTRARLHSAEHFYESIESSTDSVKSKKLVKGAAGHKGFGVMQLEHFFCKECKEDVSKTNGLFVRNRLNVLNCLKGHVLKAALHGFWGNPEMLLGMWKKGVTNYYIDRMPLIREGLTQVDKFLFRMRTEERNLNIDWSELRRM
jgi:hypothetical protein